MSVRMPGRQKLQMTA